MNEDGRTSLGAYAKHRGCSRQAVSRAWKSGRLQASVVLVEGRPTIPDFDRADVEWAENTDHARHPEIRLPDVDGDGDEGAGGTGYSGAAAREKHWKAELAELNYKQRAGELVNAADMAAEMADAFSTVRTKLLGLPSKAKQLLPHLTLADLATLDSIVRESLEELASDDAEVAA